MMAVQRGTAPELVVNVEGDAIRDFVHGADMAEAFALALDACEPGAARVYNIGSGRPTPVRDVIGRWNRSPGGPSPDDTCHLRPNRKSYLPTARQFRPT
jgi:UDP-glucose 4-epimerase